MRPIQYAKASILVIEYSFTYNVLSLVRLYMYEYKKSICLQAYTFLQHAIEVILCIINFDYK